MPRRSALFPTVLVTIASVLVIECAGYVALRAVKSAPPDRHVSPAEACPVPLHRKPYVNEKYGFSLLLPDTWRVVDDNGGIVFGDAEDQFSVSVPGTSASPLLVTVQSAESLESWEDANRKSLGDSVEDVEYGNNNVTIVRWLREMDGAGGVWKFAAFFTQGKVITFMNAGANTEDVGQGAAIEQLLRTLSLRGSLTYADRLHSLAR